MGSDKPGAGSNKPNKTEFDELVEIERATALVRGLDPDQAEAIVRARFDAGAQQTARAERTDEIRVELDTKSRRRRRMIVMTVAGVVIVGAVAVPVTRAIMSALDQAKALRQALAEAGAPVLKAGFERQEDWLDLAEGGASFDGPAGTCSAVVGVGTEGAGPRSIRIERPNATIEGDGGQLWCSCGDEKVVVRPAPGSVGRVAARRWSVSADVLGGVEVLRAAAIPGFTVHVDDVDLACADAAFETWVGSGSHGSPAALPPKPGGVTGKLLAAGFEPAGSLPAGRTFIVLRPDPKHCLIAVPQGEPGSLSLRGTNGTRLIAETKAALGWCTYDKAGPISLWRSGTDGGDYAILSIPADRVGGIAGLRELTRSHGLEQLEPMLAPTDLTADALAALRASTVPVASSVRAVDGRLRKKQGHRVVAFTQLQAGSFFVDTKPEARLACLPGRDDQATLQAFVCVQAKPQAWRAGATDAAQGAAAGPLPSWLTIIADVPDPEVVEVFARLLRLARRMAAQGSEPTTTDGVEETAWGATVSGRPNKTEVVAVGLTRTKPWAHPLTDGELWTLDGPVHAVKVTPDGYVKLKAKRVLGHASASRRVVVWRR